EKLRNQRRAAEQASVVHHHSAPPAPSAPPSARIPINSGFGNGLYPSIPQPMASMADTYSSMGMASYSMANNMASNSCLQQQAAAAAAASSYSCMLPPGPGRGYDPIGLGGYSRQSCPSAAQVHAMQTVNGQFGGVNNPATSTVMMPCNLIMVIFSS
ncbi:unnamed protein product, partial [Medioppia subpectinata]